MYLAATFYAFIYTSGNHAKAWTYSTLFMLPFVYYCAWACYIPNNSRKRNILIGTGYIMLNVALIVLWCFINEEYPRFTADGFEINAFDGTLACFIAPFSAKMRIFFGE